MKRKDVCPGVFQVVQKGDSRFLVYTCDEPDEDGMVLCKDGGDLDSDPDMVFHHKDLVEPEPRDFEAAGYVQGKEGGWLI